jgi:hypothetical protein
MSNLIMLNSNWQDFKSISLQVSIFFIVDLIVLKVYLFELPLNCIVFCVFYVYASQFREDKVCSIRASKKRMQSIC